MLKFLWISKENKTKFHLVKRTISFSYSHKVFYIELEKKSKKQNRLSNLIVNQYDVFFDDVMMFDV